MDAVPPRGRGAILLMVAVCVLGLTAAPGVLAQASSDEEASFGAQISAFMQSSAADADATVEQGMWNASIERVAAPEASVDRQASRLQSQLERLENRSEVLREARQNGSLTGVAYTARASAVRADLQNLRKSINETNATAQRHGVNETMLDDLREAAGSLDGPEVSAIARNVTDAGPGPPFDRGGTGGPSVNDGPGPPTEPPGPNGPADGTGPPRDVPGNATGGGPPGDEGNASGGDQPGQRGDGGSPDDNSGQGSSDNAPDNSGDSEDDPGNAGDAPGNSRDSPGQSDSGDDSDAGESGNDSGTRGGDTAGDGGQSDGRNDQGRG